MKVAFAALLVSVASISAIAQSAYEGQINGEFHGWDGETIYKLMDGHVIQQSAYHYHYHYAYSPNVIIFQSKSGGYKVQVEGDDDQPVPVSVLK
ncbi:hypothetical protein [Paraburkholderia sp. MM5482-R1]|uniref:hypothetical protein n=1 Tax=unclassified Paraburkholderia TaxID=2615204 RepID=UPI003D1D6BCC